MDRRIRLHPCPCPNASHMEFAPSPAVERTRAEFRSWLRHHCPDPVVWKRLLHGGDDRARVDFLKRWQRTVYEAGWVAVHWPSAFGGRDASLLEHLAVTEEL